MTKYGPKTQEKAERLLGEMKQGKLKSGHSSKEGAKDPKKAM